MKLEKSLNGIVPALCYNKLFFFTRELNIKVVGFVLKKLLTYF